MLSILIVFIHSSSYVINLQGETVSIYGQNAATFIQLFFTEGVCRVAVPLFLIISGYLFFITYKNTLDGYKYKLKRRFFSLAIPYTIWSAAVFFMFFIAQRIPSLASFFSTRDTTNFGILDILYNIFITSFNSPLWFCRYLIVFALLSPLFYIAIKKLPFIVIPAAFAIWFFNVNIIIRSETILFFSLGALFALHNEKLTNISKKIKHKNIIGIVALILWLGIIIFRTYYLCSLPEDVLLFGKYDPILHYSMRLSIISGLVAVWYTAPKFVEKKEWEIASYSFLIFVTHHPIASALKKIIAKIIGASDIALLITFFASAFLTITIIILAGMIVKKIMPKTYSFVTGSR